MNGEVPDRESSTKRVMMMSASNPHSGFGCDCRLCSPIGRKRSNRAMFRRIVKRRERQAWKRETTEDVT